MNRFLIFLLGCLLPLIVLGQVCDPGKGDVCKVAPPKFVPATIDPNRPNAFPEYPKYSNRFGEEGKVELELYVEVDGSVSSARIVASSGYPRLDKAAVEAVKDWKFLPPLEDGEPVRALHRQTISFNQPGSEWVNIDTSETFTTFTTFVRSHVWEKRNPTPKGKRILVLLNFKQTEVPKDGHKTKYSHGLSVLVTREMDCDSKKVKDIVTTVWSEHWAKGDYMGSTGEGEWKEMGSFDAFCRSWKDLLK
jgi:TonB family protein